MGIFNSKKERVEALRKVAIFSGMPKADLEILTQHTDETTVASGTELARQDRSPTQLVLIVRGKAIVRRNKRKIAELGPGDTIGELSLIDGGKQSATVVADGECDILAVPRAEFRVLVDDSPAFANKLLKSLASRLRDADEHMAP